MLILAFKVVVLLASTRHKRSLMFAVELSTVDPVLINGAAFSCRFLQRLMGIIYLQAFMAPTAASVAPVTMTLYATT